MVNFAMTGDERFELLENSLDERLPIVMGEIYYRHEAKEIDEALGDLYASLPSDEIRESVEHIFINSMVMQPTKLTEMSTRQLLDSIAMQCNKFIPQYVSFPKDLQTNLAFSLMDQFILTTVSSFYDNPIQMYTCEVPPLEGESTKIIWQLPTRLHSLISHMFFFVPIRKTIRLYEKELTESMIPACAFETTHFQNTEDFSVADSISSKLLSIQEIMDTDMFRRELSELHDIILQHAYHLDLPEHLDNNQTIRMIALLSMDMFFLKLVLRKKIFYRLKDQRNIEHSFDRMKKQNRQEQSDNTPSHINRIVSGHENRAFKKVLRQLMQEVSVDDMKTSVANKIINFDMELQNQAHSFIEKEIEQSYKNSIANNRTKQVVVDFFKNAGKAISYFPADISSQDIQKQVGVLFDVYTALLAIQCSYNKEKAKELGVSGRFLGRM